MIEAHRESYAGMSEKQRRLALGELALFLGYGAITLISTMLNYSRGCIQRGMKEFKAGIRYTAGDRDRAPGGGRKKIEVVHKEEIMNSDIDEAKKEELCDLRKIIFDILEASSCYGDTETTRKWINITVKRVAEWVFEITGQKYSNTSIKRIIRQLNYSLQKNQKYDQVGSRHPKRNEQFLHIHEMIADFKKTGDPIISIDTKAKEKIGDFIRPGSEYRRKHEPRRVMDHDFAFSFSRYYQADDPLFPEELLNHKAIVIPYGVYCVNTNKAYVTLGIDSDTSEFAADAILNWWNMQGKHDYPNSKRMLILTDGGGSNRSRGWLFKIALQQLTDITGIETHVCHYPPGTSKYNPIEHRLWSQVTHTWAAKPLLTLELVRDFVSSTTTVTGLTVGCEINYRQYMTEREKAEARKCGGVATGIYDRPAIRDDVLIKRYSDDPDLQKWNYIIRPHEEGKRWQNYEPMGLAS